MGETNQQIAVFEESNIRRIWHNEEWWFSVIDVVGALTDSSNARDPLAVLPDFLFGAAAIRSIISKSPLRGSKEKRHSL